MCGLFAKERTLPPIDLTALNGGGLVITQTPPRFEDAFVDLLGGGPKVSFPIGRKNAENCSRK